MSKLLLLGPRAESLSETLAGAVWPPQCWYGAVFAKPVTAGANVFQV